MAKDLKFNQSSCLPGATVGFSHFLLYPSTKCQVTLNDKYKFFLNYKIIKAIKIIESCQNWKSNKKYKLSYINI